MDSRGSGSARPYSSWADRSSPRASSSGPLSRLSDPALSELGLDQLLDRVRDALEVDTVAILLRDPEAGELVARAARGIEEEVEQGVRIPLGQGFAERIAAGRLAIFIRDVDHADILNPILREKGIRSLLGVPLIVEGDLIGVLHVGSLTPRSFNQRDLAVLDVAAARAAPGIERARLSFEFPHGLIGVAIGDVVGHGLHAAALMGRLRTSLHAYALEGAGPGRTLERVDRFVHSIGGEVTITVGDSGRWRPVRQGDSGHGLKIIGAGTGELDVSRTNDGTAVVMRRRLKPR